MTQQDNESRKWLYDKFVSSGLNVGKDYDEFSALMEGNEESRKWAFDKAQSMGLNVGSDYNQFSSLISPVPVQRPEVEQPGDTVQPVQPIENTVQPTPVATPVQDIKPLQNNDVSRIEDAPWYEEPKKEEEISASEQNRQQVMSLSEEIDNALLEQQNRNVEQFKKEQSESPLAMALAYMSPNASQHLHNRIYQGHSGQEIEYKTLQTAQRSLRDAQRMIDEADHNSQQGTFGKWIESSFAGGAARGIGQKLFDADTWDMGVSDMDDASSLMTALNTFDSGKPLTKNQQLLLDAKAVELATNAYFGSEVGRGYKAGTVTAESIPFMIEMCINPASAAGEGATSMLARYALKRFGKNAVKNNAKKYLAAKATARVIGDLAGSTAMAATTGAGRVIGGTAERMNGDIQIDNDEKGNTIFAGHEDGEDFGTAFYKSFASTTIENYSEMFGEYFEPVLSPIGGVMGSIATSKAGKKIGLNYVKDFIDNVASSDVAKVVTDFEKHAKWNGMFGEYAEEVSGGIMNALVVGDQTLDTNEDTGVFNLDQNIDTFLGVSLMGGFMSGVKTLGYRTPKYKARKAMEKADNTASLKFNSPEDWQFIREAIVSGTDEDTEVMIYNVLKNGDYSAEQKMAVLDFTRRYEEYCGVVQGEDSERGEKVQNIADGQASEEDEQQLAVSRAYDNGHEAATEERRDIIFDSQFNPDNEEAQQSYQGMLDRINEDADQWRDQQVELAQFMSTTDGKMRPAQLKAVDEEGKDQFVFIKEGKVSMTDDGTMIDVANSDETIIVVNQKTGKKEMISPKDLLYLGNEVNLDTAIDDIAKQRDTMVQQALNQANGILSFAPGDVVSFKTEDGQIAQGTLISTDGTNSVIQTADGSQVGASNAELQQLSDDLALADYKQRKGITEETPTAEQTAEQPIDEQKPNGAPSEYTNDMEIVVRDEDGQDKRAIVQGRVRYDAETLSFIPDENGSMIEYYVEGEGMKHDYPDKLNDKVVSYTTKSEESQPAVEPTKEGMTDEELISESIKSVGEGLKGQSDEFTKVREQDINNFLQRDTVVEALRKYGQGAKSVDEMIERAVADTSNEEVKTALQDVLRFDSTRQAAESFISQNVQEATEEATPMPTTQDGEPDYMSVTPTRAHTYIYNEAGLSRSEADEHVKANLDKAQDDLQKAKNAASPKMGTSIKKFNEQKEKRQQKIDDAKRRVDYWAEVSKQQSDIVAAKRAEQAAKDAAAHDAAVEANLADREEQKRKDAERQAVGNQNVMPEIRDKWEKATKIDGESDEIMLPNGKSVNGHYVLHESGAATASHQSTAGFAPTEGYPLDENGNNANTRDYEHNKNDQDYTRQIAGSYNQMALDKPVVVSRDGVVLSGNGRTMAGELAAQDGTDQAYIDYLKKYGYKKYGFSPEQIASMQHPRIAFVPDVDMPYNSETFDMFNKSDMKENSKTEESVKLGKTVSDDVYQKLIRLVGESGTTLGEFYNNDQATSEAVSLLISSGIIGSNEVPKYASEGKLSDVGRDLIENILVGKAFGNNPDAVRMLTAVPSLRKSAVNALSEITNNMGMNEEYNLQQHLSDAIGLAYKARTEGGYGFGDPVSGYARQLNLFKFEDEMQTEADVNDATTLILADLLNSGRESDLKKFMKAYNERTKESADGQIDMWTGEVMKRDDIIKELINEFKYIQNNGRKQKSTTADGNGFEQTGESVPSVQGRAVGQRDGGNQSTSESEEPLEDRLIASLSFSFMNDGIRETKKLHDIHEALVKERVSMTDEKFRSRKKELFKAMETAQVALAASEEKLRSHFDNEGVNNTEYDRLKDEKRKRASEYNEAAQWYDAASRVDALYHTYLESEATTLSQGTNEGKPVPIGKGKFGNIYDQFKGKARDAVAFLLKQKEGEALAALHHKDIGDIDLVWGEEGTGKSDGYGLAKLSKYHPEVLENLQEILDDMVVTKRTDNRVQLESDKYQAAVRLTWDNEKKTWLLTMFEKKSSVLDNTTDTGETHEGNGNDTATPENTAVSGGKGTEESPEIQEKVKENAESGSINSNNVETEPGNAQPTAVQQTIAQAEAEVDTEPTEAQKKAGNYKKGHVNVAGFDLTIENPKGSVRSGVDENGNEWSNTMNNTYGYIRGTEGVDGDHIDVFLADDMDAWDGKTVFIVDQKKRSGKTFSKLEGLDGKEIDLGHEEPVMVFDEHKVMLGFNDSSSALDAYLSNYEEGWFAEQDGVDISSCSLEDFKKWIDSSHRKTKPFSEYSSIKSAEKTTHIEPLTEGYTIEKKSKVNKKGEDGICVNFTERVSKEEFRGQTEIAKKFDGYYSRGKGFVFKTEEKAHDFAETVMGRTVEEVEDEAPITINEVSSANGGENQTKVEDTSTMQQVDVEGLFGALARNGEAKLSDYAKPVVSENTKEEVKQEPKHEEPEANLISDIAKALDANNKAEARKSLQQIRERIETQITQENAKDMLGDGLDELANAYSPDLTENQKQAILSAAQIFLNKGYQYFPESAEETKKAVESIFGKEINSQFDWAKEEVKTEPKQEKSKWVNDEDAARFEELKARMRAKLGQLNMNIDPEVFMIGTEMGFLMLKKGARKLQEFAQALIDICGDGIRPYITSIYDGARRLSSEEVQSEMSSHEEVDNFDAFNFDKTGAKDIIATAEHKTRELEAQQVAAETEQQLKDKRNENKHNEEKQIAADTEAVVNEAETSASEIESKLENARTEEELKELSDNADKSLVAIDEQLDKLDIGTRYTSGMEVKLKDERVVRIMTAVEHGEQTNGSGNFSRPFIERYYGTDVSTGEMVDFTPDMVDIEMTESRIARRKEEQRLREQAWAARQNRPKQWFNLKEGDKVMYKGKVCTVNHFEGYGDDRPALDTGFAPVLYEVPNWNEISAVPQEDYVAMAQRIAEENKESVPAGSTTTETKKNQKEKSKKKVADDTQMGDLFGELFGEEDVNQPTNNNNNEQQEVHVQSRTSETGREEGQQPRQNEPLGTSKQHGAERPDGRGMGGRDASNPLPNQTGSGSVSRQSKSEPSVEETPAQPKNTRNNHAERGTDYAPKSENARIEANIKAIETMQRLMENGEQATPEDMDILRRFSGWGGLGSAFRENAGEYRWTQKNPINQKLRSILTPEQYESANMSRNSAYYTPAEVIDAMWDIARALGFKGGNVLEGSAGIGNIIGLMPTDMSQRSNIHAVEIDDVTGNILSLLYPDAKVDVQGFEKTSIQNGSIDLAITNVPFVTGLHVNDESGDKDLSRKFRDIHDFCIAKNVRKLSEGGIGIFITSSGTLDNSQKLRNWLVNEGNADVVGAFRLNNKTFGGTGATSDIIVVRKRINGKKSANAIDVSNIGVLRTAEYEAQDSRSKKSKTLALDINAYYIQHPEQMAGEMNFAFEKGESFRATSKALYPSADKNQSQMLSDWAKSFSTKDWELAITNRKVESSQVIYDELGEDVKEGSMIIDKDGKLRIARGGKAMPIMVGSGKSRHEMNDAKVKKHTKVECFKSYKAIKDALSELLDYQTNNESDEGLQPLINKLNRAYDSFVRIYGNINNNQAISFLRNDMEFPSIAALESVNEVATKSGDKTVSITKTDIFSRRVVDKESMPKPTTIKDGIIASIYLNGRVDVPYIAEQLGLSESDVRQQIVESGLGFQNPMTGEMEVSYEYLSGNVREKLRQAKDNNADGKFDANIKALEKIIPMDIPAHLIEFTLGSSWIEPKLFEDFVKDRTDIEAKLSNIGGVWMMTEPYYVANEKNKQAGVRSELLGKIILGHELIKAAMQNKTIQVSSTRKNYDGTTETIVDKDATKACSDRIDEIRQDFKDWARERMQTDQELSKRMEKSYNEQFNNYVPKSIPDEFVPEHFGGAAKVVNGKPFKLREHQAKAAIRATTQPLMLAHEVGTGKTYTLITTAMEMRRLGTARKPMVVVQNATVGQFVSSAKSLYPNAKILTLEDADRTAEGRMYFYAKIRYNDWDMIVVPQSVFERIPDSPEREAKYKEELIEEKMAVIAKMREASDNPDRDSNVRMAEKELEKLRDELNNIRLGITDAKKGKSQKDEKREAKTRQNAEVRAEEMLDRETDDTMNFDEMGIDALLVDEAHEYKHLGFTTAMQRGVKGVDPSYSKKSQGVYLKTQAVLEKNNGKNVVFATGTPISNTAAEIWTFMRYLMPADTMKEYDIYYFDDFVRNFGNIQNVLEFGASGKYKPVNRFLGYFNLPELVRIWSGVADTVLTKDAGGVKDKIPEMEGGKAQDVYLPQTRSLRSIMKYVKQQLQAYEQMSGKEKRENSHIPLVMFGIAKAAAVDTRLVQDDAVDEEYSKTNETVRQILRSLKETKSYKGTVAVFADNYQNKHSGFNLYEDIRAKLIAAGVPAEQIIIMRSGMTVKNKLEIFEKVNRGDARVIMGSTFTLGTGVNIQERLHTLIHIDAPVRPMDYTQRNGRILRQGNMHRNWNKPVRVLRFGVEDSLDVTAYQRLKTKGAIADSVMEGKKMIDNGMENRSIEEDQDIFGDITAQLSGSQYALLKQQAEKVVRSLSAKKSQHEQQQTYIHNRVPRLEENIAEENAIMAKNQDALKKVEAIKDKTIKIGGTTYNSIDEMSDYIKEFNKKQHEIQESVRTSYNDKEKQTRNLTINVGGYDFVVNSTISKEMSSNEGQYSISWTAKTIMTYSCPELGLEDIPVHGQKIKSAIEDIILHKITGDDFRDRIEYSERYIESDKKELELLRSLQGKPFAEADKLAEAQAKLAEYEDAMQKELEEKEAKYAELDKEVGEAENVNLDYETEDEEESDDEKSELAFRFIGEQGAKTLDDYDKGRRISFLLYAKYLEKEGKSEKEIKLQSGWERGKDGRWRYETPDDLLSRENLVQLADGSTTLAELLPEDNEFLKAYPQLSSMQVSLAELPEGKKGDYLNDSQGGRIRVALPSELHSRLQLLADIDNILKNGYTELQKANAESLGVELNTTEELEASRNNILEDIDGILRAVNETFVHEIQHAIQNIEGFANGGSPNMFNEDELDKLVREVNSYAKILKNSTPKDRNNIRIIEESLDKDDVNDIDKDAFKRAFTSIRSSERGREYINRLNKLLDFDENSANYNKYVPSRYRKYRSLVGEVEARNVTSRIDMTEEERLNSLASETEDVQRDEQIVRYDDVVSASEVMTEEVDKLEDGGTIKAYRAMQLIDGELYPPMAAVINGELVKPAKFGRWYQSEEHPELIDPETGTFKLNKGQGKGTVPAAYNPYFHSSLSPLNDQFSSAYVRPNLVIVEVEIPKSELTSGYKAAFAKDAVGEMSWHSGSVSGALAEAGKPRRVMLSRYCKISRILTNEEVGNEVAKLLQGTDIDIPYNVVTPQLAEELKKHGIKIGKEASGTVGENNGFGKAEYVTDEQINAINEKMSENALNSIEAKKEHATRLSSRFGVTPTIIENVEDIKNLPVYKNADENTRKKMLRSQGWYDNSTKEIVVVLPNNTDVEDVAATIFHETVAHKGLRELVGEENYSAFLREVYESLNAKTRSKITNRAMSNGWNYEKAMDEYFGELAEKGFEDFDDKDRSVWQVLKQKVLDAINKLLTSLKLPKWVKLGDNELRYMLWRSAENLERGKENLVQVAQDVVKRNELKIGEEIMFNEKETHPTLLQTSKDAQADQRGKFPGTKVEINTENRKEIEENLSNLAKKVTEKQLSAEDFLSELRKSMLTESSQHSGYNEMDLNGTRYTLRVSDHHANARNNKRNNQFKVTSVVVKLPFANNRFRADKDVEMVEFIFDQDKLSQANEIDIVEGLQKWMNTGVCEIKGANVVRVSPNINGSDISFREPGETEDIWADQSLGFTERMTAAAIKLSDNHSEDKRLRNEALRAISSNLQELRQAMSLQRKYDRATVKRVYDLARILMNKGFINDLNQQEVRRLLSTITKSVGVENIDTMAQKVLDIMVDNQLHNAKANLNQLMSIKGSKVNAKGVEVQGQLDPDGQRTMAVFKKAWTLPAEDIEQRISEAVNRMGSQDNAVADEAAIEYAGLQIAHEYVQNIGQSIAEEKDLRDEMKQKNEDVSESDRSSQSYREYIESIEEAIRKNKAERVENYYHLIGRLTDSLRESIANAAAFREAERQRINLIHHEANSDMQGRPSDEHHKPTFKEKFANNAFVSFMFSPLATFDQMLRMLGSKSANGEGYLYNRFMRGWVNAREKEIKGVKEKYAILDEKVQQIFGKRNMTFGDLIRMESKLPKATVSFYNGGEMQEHELSQGNLLYIYMVNKMLDGAMKLRKMGISSKDVADIESVLDPRFKMIADWLQEEFLVNTRNEYNETHKRMFGASMAAIEDYFPIRILANARADKPEDIDNPKINEGISTTTGSIIKRRRNALALDITGADAFNVLLEHIAQMEHWNAFVEWNRDLNTLRTYRRFRNQILNMTSIYGAGKDLWKKFNDVCQMAAGTYKAPRAKLDEAAVNFAKGVTSAKVCFRIFTALKQILSMPAFVPDINVIQALKNPQEPFTWCLENLPVFAERWQSRMIGDPRLLKSDMDWKLWRSRVMQIASRVGMSPNALIDAVTISIGSYAMYKTKKAQYLKDGYNAEQAEKRAKQDATILFNQTQQSSEGAFLSTIQVDRSWLSVLFTVFRNSSMSYQRQLHDAVRNLKRNINPRNYEETIDFMARQMERDGVAGDPYKSAVRKFRRQMLKDTIRVATFGYIMQLAWNLGAYLPYLIFGDDDDEKQKMMDDVWAHTMFGWAEGLTGGDVISQAGAMYMTGEGNPAYLSKDMPLTGDVAQALQKIGNGQKMEALSDIINLIVQSGVGVNPQSITDGVLAIMDACGDDPELAHEAAICVSRILQVPQSQIDQMYFDEVGLSGEEVSAYTPAELAERYAKFKVKRGRFYAPWSWDDTARIESQKKKANSAIKGRLANVGDKSVNESYAEIEESNKVLQTLETELNKAKKSNNRELAIALATDLMGDNQAFLRYKTFKKLDSTLDKLVDFYMKSKEEDEAELCKQTIIDFKKAMVDVINAESENEQQSAIEVVSDLMKEFANEHSKYRAANQ